MSKRWSAIYNVSASEVERCVTIPWLTHSDYWMLSVFLFDGNTHPARGCGGAEDYRSMISTFPKASCYTTSRYGEAERYLREAFNAKPGDSTAGYYLGLTSITARYTAAEERFREVLWRHPDDARARMGLGMALYHQDRYPEASAELTVAERTLKDEPLLYYYAGLAAAAQQKHDQASEKFLRAGKMDPELANDPHYQRGVALQSKGDEQQATAEFRLGRSRRSCCPPACRSKPEVAPSTSALKAVERQLWSKPPI